MADTIRVKGFEKKSADPPPAAAAPLPKALERPPAVVFKQRPAGPPPAEAAAPPQVEETAVTETPGEPYEPAPVESPEETPAEQYADAPAEACEEVAPGGPLTSIEEPVVPPPPEASTSGGIRLNFRSQTMPPKVEEVPVAPASAPALSSYDSDPDPDRVLRRQQWKWNLYVRSGRQKEDEAAKGTS